MHECKLFAISQIIWLWCNIFIIIPHDNFHFWYHTDQISLEIRATEKTISENDFSVLILLEDNVSSHKFNRAVPTSSLPIIETWSHYNDEALSNIIQDFLFWPFYLPGREMHRPICEPGTCQYAKRNSTGRSSTTSNLHFNWEVKTVFPNINN